MRLFEFIEDEEYPEIEFVCVNSEHCNATEPDAQKALWNDLNKVQGIVAYKQDWSDENSSQISMAVIIKNKNAIKTIKQLAKKHGVKIDLDDIEKRSEKYLDALVRNEIPNVINVMFNEGKGILNRGTQAHRQKKKYHRSSEYDDSFEDYDDDPLESALNKVHDIRYHKYTPEEEEALIKAGYATHTKKEAKNLARADEYPTENFHAKPDMTVKIFYWPNKEIGKPYTVFH